MSRLRDGPDRRGFSRQPPRPMSQYGFHDRRAPTDENVKASRGAEAAFASLDWSRGVSQGRRSSRRASVSGLAAGVRTFSGVLGRRPAPDVVVSERAAWSPPATTGAPSSCARPATAGGSSGRSRPLARTPSPMHWRSRRGVILTSVHLGDFDLAASWIAEVLGSRPVVPVARCPSRAWQSFYDGVRVACGFALRCQEATGLADLERELERGRLIILMLDRRPTRSGVTTRWCGREATVSAAAATLACYTGASLVSTATWGDGSGGRTLAFGPPAQRNRPAMRRPSPVRSWPT